VCRNSIYLALVSFLLPALLAGPDRASAQPVKELREVRTILPGVLTTAGGSGGMNSLDQGQIQVLCKEGYSTVYYLYAEKFSNPGLNDCGVNKTDYLLARFEGEHIRPIFTRVKQVVEQGGGPVMAHCWNGRHASGAVAAKAFMQFCDWSAERAVEYWLLHAGSDGPAFKFVIRDIRGFAPYSDLKLTTADQARLCP